MTEYNRTTIDPAEVSWIDVYRRLTEVVVPRPIALVSTVDGDGRPNLAPFSFFTVVSSNPPFLAFSPHRAGRSGAKKDTLRNLEVVGEFVVSITTRAIADRVNSCAATLPYGDSEFQYSGLTPSPAERVRPPLVSESPVSIECELVDLHSYGEEGGAGTLAVGRVVLVHLASEVLDSEGRIAADRLDAVGRMGSNLWVGTSETFEMERPE
ncbi:MAG: flavin reductase family protein [bacterium]|nr:flavin reductase family protein [bacterium]